MADNTKAGFAAIKSIAAPRFHEAQARPDLAGQAASIAAGAVSFGLDQYFNNAASSYEQAVDQVARSTFSSEEFTKGVAEKVDPNYRFEALFNNRIQQSKRTQPTIGKAIDAAALRQDHEIKSSLVLDQMIQEISQSADYNQWLTKAEALNQSVIDQYGSTPPGFATHFEERKRVARDRFARGLMDANRQEYLDIAVSNFLIKVGTKVTAESVKEFIEDKVIPGIRNSENDNWKQQIPRILNNLVVEAPNAVEGVKIVNEFDDYLTPTQKSGLVSAAMGITERNAQIGKNLLAKNHQWAASHFERGIPVSENKLLNSEDIATNKFIEEQNLSRRSPASLVSIAQETGRYDIISPVIDNLYKDFANDFVGALNNWRAPTETVPPLILPRIAQGDVKDENGNIVNYKGDVIGSYEFFDSVKRRGVLAESTANTYGDAVTQRFGEKEMQEIKGFRDSLDSFEKRTAFDRDFIKALGVNEIGDKYAEFVAATGDSEAASVYRQMDNPPRIQGGANTILKNFQQYDSMRKNKPDELVTRSEWATNILDYPKSTSTGIRVLPDTISEELRTFLRTNAVGATAHLDKKKASEYIDKQYSFWTRRGFFDTKSPPLEGFERTARDWFYGDTGTLEAIFGKRKNNIERHGAVTASQADYMMLNKIISGRTLAGFTAEMGHIGINIATGNLKSLIGDFAALGMQYDDIRMFLPDTGLEKRFALKLPEIATNFETPAEGTYLGNLKATADKVGSAVASLADKIPFLEDLRKEIASGKVNLTLDTWMLTHPNYTVKNYHNSLKDFALVEVDDMGLSTIVKDANGKEIVFSIP